MISKRLLGKAALALAIAGVSVTAYATHSWNGYHWARTTSSFTLQTLDSTVQGGTNANWPVLLGAAASQWSQSTKLDLNVVPYTNTSQARRKCSAVSGKIRVCNAAYGNNGWLGLASINITGGTHITQGTAKMNDSYATTYARDANEAAHVMCQEVGHTFGLGHTSEDGSTQNTCMDYSSSPTSTKPNQHDYDQLVSIYGHTDTTTTVSAMPAPKLTADQVGMMGDVPLGTLVRKGHFSETYAAPDGKGGLWITHVTLAPGFEHLHAE